VAIIYESGGHTCLRSDLDFLALLKVFKAYIGLECKSWLGFGLGFLMAMAVSGLLERLFPDERVYNNATVILYREGAISAEDAIDYNFVTNVVK
jgi:hypothetical protein